MTTPTKLDRIRALRRTEASVLARRDALRAAGAGSEAAQAELRAIRAEIRALRAYTCPSSRPLGWTPEVPS